MATIHRLEPLQGVLEPVSITQLREAARAWCTNDVRANQHRNSSGWFKWIMPEPDMSLYDRIDNLIDEIERLRSRTGA